MIKRIQDNFILINKNSARQDLIIVMKQPHLYLQCGDILVPTDLRRKNSVTITSKRRPGVVLTQWCRYQVIIPTLQPVWRAMVVSELDLINRSNFNTVSCTHLSMYVQDILCGISKWTCEVPMKTPYTIHLRYKILYKVVSLRALKFKRWWAFLKRLLVMVMLVVLWPYYQLLMFSHVKLFTQILDSFTISLHSPNDRHLSIMKAVQGDCQ